MIVTAVTALPGGRVASALSDGTQRVLNAFAGKCFHVLMKNDVGGPIMLQAASASGLHLLAATDGAARVWRTADGSCMHTLEVDAVVMCACFLPGDAGIAPLALQVRVCNAATGAWQHTLEGHTDWVTSVTVVAADGAWWRAATGEQVRACASCTNTHTNCIMSLLVLPDGRARTTAVGQAMRVWSASGKEGPGCGPRRDLMDGPYICAQHGERRRRSARPAAGEVHAQVSRHSTAPRARRWRARAIRCVCTHARTSSLALRRS